MENKKLKRPCDTCEEKECFLMQPFGECFKYTEWMYQDMGKDPAEDTKLVNRVKKFLFG